MKFILVENSTDNIISRVNLNNIDEANVYFKGVKRMPDEIGFDKLWRVMSEKDYDNQRDLALRQNKQYEWWKDIGESADEEDI